MCVGVGGRGRKRGRGSGLEGGKKIRGREEEREIGGRGLSVPSSVM